MEPETRWLGCASAVAVTLWQLPGTGSVGSGAGWWLPALPILLHLTCGQVSEPHNCTGPVLGTRPSAHVSVLWLRDTVARSRHSSFSLEKAEVWKS